MLLKPVSTLVMVVGLAGGAAVPAEPPKGLPGAARRELRSLQGKWRVVKFLHADRETAPGADGREVVVEFKGGTIDFAGAAEGAVVALDPATDPKCLDFTARVGSGVFKTGMTYESVYRLDGDSLSWAVYHGRGKSRPVAFGKPTDAGVMVMVLRRVKE